VVAGVIADLKAIAVELGDLLPGEVVRFVGTEAEAFGNEERRAKPVLFEERPTTE
jgi:hypothetical protein